MVKSKYIICVDGNIGSGKTTLVKSLEKTYTCFPEPVEEWTLLPKLYDSPYTYAVPFQFQVMLSQYNQYKKFENIGSVVIVERCPWTSKHVFVDMMVQDGYFDPQYMGTYNQLYDTLSYQVDHYIYLDVDPEIAMGRISLRDRFAERKLNITYIQRLHEQYTKVLNTLDNKTIVDASGCPHEVEAKVLEAITRLVA